MVAQPRDATEKPPLQDRFEDGGATNQDRGDQLRDLGGAGSRRCTDRRGRGVRVRARARPMTAIGDYKKWDTLYDSDEEKKAAAAAEGKRKSAERRREGKARAVMVSVDNDYYRITIIFLSERHTPTLHALSRTYLSRWASWRGAAGGAGGGGGGRRRKNSGTFCRAGW